jgi:hypothetical protein
MRHSSSCVLKITGNNGIANGWLREMDRPPTHLHLNSLTHGTQAKQGAPSEVGRGKEWSVSITWQCWPITTEQKEAMASISDSFGK